jgi:hypothetical protein
MAAGPAPAPDDIVRLQGRGVVYRNGERLGETGYDLMIVPPHHRRPVLGPNNPPTGRPDITGSLTESFFLDGNVRGGELTLVLQDGRRFEFKVLVPDTNEIVAIDRMHY